MYLFAVFPPDPFAQWQALALPPAPSGLNSPCGRTGSEHSVCAQYDRKKNFLKALFRHKPARPSGSDRPGDNRFPSVKHPGPARRHGDEHGLAPRK